MTSPAMAAMAAMASIVPLVTVGVRLYRVGTNAHSGGYQIATAHTGLARIDLPDSPKTRLTYQTERRNLPNW